MVVSGLLQSSKTSIKTRQVYIYNTQNSKIFRLRRAICSPSLYIHRRKYIIIYINSIYTRFFQKTLYIHPPVYIGIYIQEMQMSKKSGRDPGNVEKHSGKRRKKIWDLIKNVLDSDPDLFRHFGSGIPGPIPDFFQHFPEFFSTFPRMF